MFSYKKAHSMNWETGTLKICKDLARRRYSDGREVRMERVINVPRSLKSTPVTDTFRVFWSHRRRLPNIGVMSQWNGDDEGFALLFNDD